VAGQLAADRARAPGVESLAHFQLQDFFELDMRGSDIFSAYLLPEVNSQAHAAPVSSSSSPGAHRHARLRLGEWHPTRYRLLGGRELVGPLRRRA